MRFYILLLKADPSEAEAATAKKEAVKKTPAKPKKKEAKSAKKPEVEVPENDPRELPVAPTPAASAQPVQTVLNNAPELHINIQLHISPESSAEQIDKIFESMAKHLKDFNK